MIGGKIKITSNRKKERANEWMKGIRGMGHLYSTSPNNYMY
jgi:hypothetical protein